MYFIKMSCSESFVCQVCADFCTYNFHRLCNHMRLVHPRVEFTCNIHSCKTNLFISKIIFDTQKINILGFMKVIGKITELVVKNWVLILMAMILILFQIPSIMMLVLVVILKQYSRSHVAAGENKVQGNDGTNEPSNGSWLFIRIFVRTKIWCS